ncbi:MAG: DUF1501 domain-containing protein [Bacteroidota bacterium]
MKRRNFLKNIGRLSSAPLVLNGLAVSPFASPSMLQLLNCQGIDERVLVIVFLKGGNDGLNTLVPINQYGVYQGLRPDIALPEAGANGLINLDSGLALADQVGLHPAMTAFKDMYDGGQARVLQGIGYPSFNQSHFKSTDLWLSGGDGSPANFNITSGWMGRYLEAAFPSISGNPTPQFPDPLGIQLGDTKPSLGLHNHDQLFVATNLTGQNPANLFGLLNGLGTAPHATVLDSEYGDEIQYIMEVENSTNAYGERITDVYNAGNNSSTTYPNSSLGGQLRTVARLLAGGSTTKIFMVHKGGFDNHANQVQGGSSHLGTHANLLTDVFDSIQAFHDDLSSLGLESKVVTSTFSEFGRRATQNGSFGTDHGNLAPMFLFGSSVNPGVSGTNLDLSNLTANGNFAENLQLDYRSVFKSLLQDWLGAAEVILSEAMFDPFAEASDLIDAGQVVDPTCYIGPAVSLPVVLTTFEAEVIEDKVVLLQWSTSSEVNSDYFEVERSKDGSDFEYLGRVAARGESSSFQSYELLDEEPLLGTSYYRLRSVDLDDTFAFSDVRSVTLNRQLVSHFKLYPNPAIYDANVVLTSTINTAATVQLYAVDGSQVLSRDLSIDRGFNKLAIDVSRLTAGQYLLQLEAREFALAPIPLVVGTD